MSDAEKAPKTHQQESDTGNGIDPGVQEEPVVLPHDDAAERRVVAGLFNAQTDLAPVDLSAAVDALRLKLAPEDFFSIPLGALYAGLLAAHDAKKPFDRWALCEWAVQQGQQKRTATEAALATADEVRADARAELLPDYAGRIRTLAISRQVATGSDVARAAALSGDATGAVREVQRIAEAATARAATSGRVRRVAFAQAENPPKEEFICGALLPLGKVSVFWGPMGTGKTALVAQLVFRVAANEGGLFLSMPLRKGGPVLVYTVEDTYDDWCRKAGAVLHDWRATVGAEIADDDMQRALGNLGVMENTDGMARLTEVVQVRTMLGNETHTRSEHTTTAEHREILLAARAMGAVLVVVETTSRLVEEESNEEISQLIAACGHIASETGAAVLLTHHPNKASAKENDSSPETGRGGYAFIANARSGMSLYPAPDANVNGIAGEYGLQLAPGDVVLLEHQKGTSSVRKQEPIYLVRCDTPWGAVLTLPSEVQADPAQAQEQARRAAQQQVEKQERFAALYDVAEELAKAEPPTKNRLRTHHEKIGVAKNKVDALVDGAIAAGVLVVKERDKKGRILALGLGTRPCCEPARPDVRATAAGDAPAGGM